MASSTLKPELPPLLAPGFHRMSVAELAHLCVAHEQFSLSVTRKAVFTGLVAVILELNKAGITGELWIDGSFVTTKIDPMDVDMLLRVQAGLYDSDAAKRAAVDWASSANLLDSHLCDSYRWVEYSVGHPLFADSEADREYWTDWFGHSRPPKKTPKGLVVIDLPANLKAS